jgi:hypothetical protein
MYREENEMSSIWSGGRVSKMDDAGPRVEIKRNPREIEKGNPSKPDNCLQQRGREEGKGQGRGQRGGRGRGTQRILIRG